MTDSDVWHVYPERDLIEHDTDTDGCLCKPTVTGVQREDGSYGWVSTHHSLDGREFSERDYTGPSMPKETK